MQAADLNNRRIKFDVEVLEKIRSGLQIGYFKLKVSGIGIHGGVLF